MLHAVIMAGGSGTRFWPESRNDRPKQLLQLAGERTMLQSTVDRLGSLVTPDRTWVITAARLVTEVKRQLPALPAESIVGEPCKRDTAPCIGLAALLVSRHDPDATMLVLPSDHVISPDARFQQAVRQAAELVEASPGRIVTFGIKPTYAAESFGYIERGETLGAATDDDTAAAYRVKRFREKPPAAVAAEYLAAGTFLWNSGIFVWKATTILTALRQQRPDVMEHLEAISSSFETPDFGKTLDREFAAIKGVSIDYAVMEHAQDVAVIEAPFAWDDVGSWQAIARLRGADDEGNTIDARHVGLRSRGCIVRGPRDHLIVTLGLQDCIVVHTPTATLVANKHDEESIRQIVQLLQQQGYQDVL